MKISKIITSLKSGVRSYSRLQILVYLAIIGCSTIFLGVFFFYFVKLGPASYPLGDMLINYSCGMIRRGLLGTVLLNVSQVTKLDVFGLYANICLAIYLGVYAFVFFKLKRFTLILLLVIIAPFGFMFIVNDWRAFGYKDIFILSFLLLILDILKHYRGKFLWITVSLLMLTATLIHELFIFISCPFILLHLISIKRKGFENFNFNRLIQGKKNIILFLMLTGGLLISVILITNGNNSFKAACLREGYKKILIGRTIEPLETNKNIFWPLEWLESGMSDAISLTSNNYLNPVFRGGAISQLALLCFTLVLVIIYAFGFGRVVSFFKANYLLILYLFLSMVSTFIIGSDWGRWMYLLFMHVIIFFSVNNDLIVDRKKGSNGQGKFVYLFLAIFIIFIFIRVPSFYLSGDSLTDTVFIRLFKSFFN